MNKIMTLVASIMMIATANASDNSVKNPSAEPLKLEPFSEVNVNVPARIKMVQGKDYGVVANAAHSYDLTYLDYHVKDGVLYISTESKDMLRSSGRGTVITVITPDSTTNIKVGNDVLPVRKK